MKPRLIVMVKEPRPGRVKTRLAADIGRIEATWWFRHQVRSLLRRLNDSRWETVLSVAPDPAVTSRAFPCNLPRLPQGRGDLGTRMARAMSGHRAPVCVIGADIPGINRAAIARAFHLLGSHDAVFGPAPDGGYWLVGLKHAAPLPAGLFDGVRWSTEHALVDSVASLRGRSVGFAATLRDVDTAADLQ
ncbi:MAG: TIGR04282 family arsenosugar biosynthesis glycosyltransferase [Pseudomonadota bacterium]